MGAPQGHVQQILGWAEVSLREEHGAVTGLPPVASAPGAGGMLVGTQEPLDSSDHGVAMAVLLIVPQPLVTRAVGPRQPETQNGSFRGLSLGAES